MPTGANNDVIPVRRRTKRALEALKGRGTYDEVVRALLEAVPPDEARARLGARQAMVRARMASPEARAGAPRREPDKQLMIAMLAERRWRQWLRDGQVTRLGPRRYRWNLGVREPAEGGVRLVRRFGRGLAAGEGPGLPQ